MRWVQLLYAVMWSLLKRIVSNKLQTFVMWVWVFPALSPGIQVVHYNLVGSPSTSPNEIETDTQAHAHTGHVFKVTGKKLPVPEIPKFPDLLFIKVWRNNDNIISMWVKNWGYPSRFGCELSWYCFIFVFMNIPHLLSTFDQ